MRCYFPLPLRMVKANWKCFFHSLEVAIAQRHHKWRSWIFGARITGFILCCFQLGECNGAVATGGFVKLIKTTQPQYPITLNSRNWFNTNQYCHTSCRSTSGPVVVELWPFTDRGASTICKLCFVCLWNLLHSFTFVFLRCLVIYDCLVLMY